ncbi:MAG TPA: L-glutamate gamma-semialdehyde dehydrogenase [Baekduia sp.]|nr:L-glutamate gamma-semialdehyde dehydrogenase [Baekduia sp.]
MEERLRTMSAEKVDMPMVIGGIDVYTGNTVDVVVPHNISHVLGQAHVGGLDEINQAIEAAGAASASWSETPWEERAGVFLRAAEMISGAGPWRDTLNAATMLGQSKTIHQAEIDAACEVCDFFRYLPAAMLDIYRYQPQTDAGVWNRVEYRPLEGFVAAISPFNFTAIAANLPAAPALMGNTVVWKPAPTTALSSYYLMRLLQAAGLPDGVINLVHAPAELFGSTVVEHPDLAGIHFTGSSRVFQKLWADVGKNIRRYRNYPRVVGETGGKDFVVAHPSADVDGTVAGIMRGAFEYQGQKCSAASRVYIPECLWPDVRDKLCAEVSTIPVGDVSDFSNYMGAVIDETAFRRLDEVLREARESDEIEVLVGGGTADSVGWFVEPTVVLTRDPSSRFMTEEFFGPIVCVFVYSDDAFAETLQLIDQTGMYGLTGSIYSTQREPVQEAMRVLRYAAGNFTVNDKPSGGVVGQQPFGGARASGTNDKAGTMWNLMRWVSPRTIKETLVMTRDYRYAFMEDQEGANTQAPPS